MRLFWIPIAKLYRKTPEKYRDKAREYYQRHKEKIRAQVNAYRKRYPEKRERWNATNRTLRQNIKFFVLAAYSEGQPRCACCGETIIEFLSIDHINGKGRRDIKAKRIWSGTGLYRWLAKNDFPEGFQVLCMNCNFARRQGKLCPHEEKRLYDLSKKPEED